MKKIILLLSLSSCQFLASPTGMAIQEEIAEEVVEYIIEEINEEDKENGSD